MLGSFAAKGEVVDIMIHHFAFEPPEITIEQGTTVRWTNMDFIIHTATSQTGPGTLIPSGLFDSGELNFGDTFEFTFQTPGTAYYFCIPHGSSMQGTVHVIPMPPPCDGDIDADRDVDLLDLTLFLSAFGSMAGSAEYLSAADWNADNQIDLIDLATILSLFGRIC